MSQNNAYFHFTLGPVQGFVSQARRTRDFWAGSFLLSWLAGVAMEAVKIQGGKIIFPIPDDAFLSAIRGENTNHLPKQGGIPNRFMADIDQCASFSGQAVTDAVNEAWLAVCDVVWERDKAGLVQDNNKISQSIWYRQVTNFWDMNWVITQTNDTSALDKRKNLRTHVPSEESGYKCMMMEGYQELSGADGKNSGNKRKSYWNKLILLNHTDIDLRDGEQLCAIAYVKRRFVREFKKVRQSIEVQGQHIIVYGWSLPHNIPSTAYMAATPWLLNLFRQDQQTLAYFSEFNQALEEMARIDETFAIHSERKNHIKSLQGLTSKAASLSLDDISLDGNVYYPSYWDNIRNLVGDKNNYDGRVDAQRKQIIKTLTNLYKAMEHDPSPYYAILLMDGDSLGKQMGFTERQPIISQALNEFTQRAQVVVREHDGFLVYAGGDDVLALFSLNNAMRAAAALQDCYKQCFAQASSKEVPVYSTLSGAINYCHINASLTHVLTDSHDLLDNVAKDGTGRNALAVRVWKPSGLAVQWSQPWDKVLDANYIQNILQAFDVDSQQLDTDNLSVIEALSLAMQKLKQQESSLSVFSSSFFYKTRDLMAMLEEMMQQNNLQVRQAEQLLLAEFLQSGQFGRLDDAMRDKLIQMFGVLIEQSRNYQSFIDDSGKARVDKSSGQCISGDAGILLRILGQKGLGKGDKV